MVAIPLPHVCRHAKYPVHQLHMPLDAGDATQWLMISLTTSAT